MPAGSLALELRSEIPRTRNSKMRWSTGEIPRTRNSKMRWSTGEAWGTMSWRKLGEKI